MICPLVSIITPVTAARAQYEPGLNAMVAAQDYPHIEHIYIREEGLTIGAKRNLGCERAQGDIILHMDSDDWYSPGWVSSQVAALLQTGADIVGLKELYFYHEQQHRAWIYKWDEARAWVAGGTMCYHKSFWQKHKFQDIQLGEDNYFVWTEGAKVAANDYLEGFVARLHSGNSAPHNKSRMWQETDAGKVSSIISVNHPSSAGAYAPGTN